MAAAPSSRELWSGDPDLEPLVEDLHRCAALRCVLTPTVCTLDVALSSVRREFKGLVTPKECVDHLRNAEWRLVVAKGLVTIDLQKKQILALEQDIANAKSETQAYKDGRDEHDRKIHEAAMKNAEEFAAQQGM